MPLDPSSSKAERTLVFGPEGNLVGTLTPPAPRAAAARAGVLLTNVGLNPRCGPYGVNAELARACAQAGLPSLRFDLSGLGDSARPADAQPLPQQWIRDARAAMDALEREYGLREFIMIGICSGADLALLAATEDARLRAVALFDPYLYPTWRTKLRGIAYRLHALGPATTLRLAAGRVARIARRLLGTQPARSAEDEATLRYGPSVPTLDEFAGRLGAIVDGGARVLLAYSGSYPYYYNYEGQCADNLRPYGLHDRVETALIRNSDHVLMGVPGRRRFVEVCAEFAVRAI